ncbi:PDZ domain-containing protein [Heyndrickxia coagulans]|uniref:PDZ domain-containing protein n=1 Tax=Heyndrickxia coagulans TaxID=1398 RepID=UPI002EA36EB7|nr:PDZ domain-containing protein [Heyndrickxia coagulans]
MFRLEQIWMTEVLKGIGRFFLHPVFYYALLLALVSGAARVKRERNDFHIRVYKRSLELRSLFPAGLICGLILSAATVAGGFKVSWPVLAVVAAVTIVFSLAGQFRLLSPAFTIGIPVLLFFAFTWLPVQLPDWMGGTTDAMVAGLSVLAGLLLLAEGVLLRTSGTKHVSPKLRKSRRGLNVGAFTAKKLWLVPVVCFLPSGPLSASVSWWPVVDWGGHTFSLVLVPFLIGFQHQIQSSLPQSALKRIGTGVICAGIMTAAIGAAGFWLPYFSAAAAVFAIVARAWISFRHRVRENNAPYYFTQRNNGMIILGIIPGSKAEKMGLSIGEVISKCNGEPVHNTDEFYRALQKSSAYCKLEVIGTNGEMHFAQGALYEGEHHELGILTVENNISWDPDQAG